MSPDCKQNFKYRLTKNKDKPKRNLHSTDTPKGSTGSTIIGRICQPKRSTMAQKQFKLIVQALLATDWLAILLNYYTPLIYNDSLTAITGFHSMSSHI